MILLTRSTPDTLERWQFDPDGLIAQSHGTFDSADYQRQLEHGSPEAK